MSKAKSHTTRSKASKRGALFVISGLLISSALVRIGDGAGRAMALAPEKMDMMAEAPTKPKQAMPTSAEFDPLIAALKTRETRIAQQEAAITDRMHALKIAEREVSRKLAELRQAEEELRATIALADTAAEDDLARLTRVYESMKPKQAAALFEEMDPNFAAGFIGRMRPEAAAALMAGLSPEAAHAFSVVLAGRNANVPDE